MSRYTLLKQSVLFLGLILFSVSCSDSTSSEEDPGRAPEILDFDHIQNSIQPDLSYFEENDPGKQTSYDNYYTGKWTAVGMGYISSLGAVYGFMPTMGLGEPTHKNGAWVWEYSYSDPSSGSISMLFSARESADNVLWDLTISLTNAEISIDNYRMIEGRISKDGNSGSWKFFNFPDESVQDGLFMESLWNRKSDTEVDMETKLYYEGSQTNWYTYSQNGTSHIMRGGNPDYPSDEVTIIWNTDTMLGSIEMDGERRCWDSNFQDTACS